MTTLLYLLGGFCIGGLAVWAAFQGRISKVKAESGRLTAELSEQKILAAAKVSKEEIEQRYVTKEAFRLLDDDLYQARQELKAAHETILELNKELVVRREKEAFLNEKMDVFREEIAHIHEKSKEQFRNLATDLLEEKKKSFVEANKTELNHLLDPLKTDLSNFKKSIEDTRKEDIQDLTSLKKEIDLLHKLNVQLSDDAHNLATALKSDNKMQGNWGEDRLNLILETEGLQAHIDYTTQGSYRDEEQGLIRRPDLILQLPGNRHIVIDSKVSLNAYVNYFNATQPEEKSKWLKLHLKSVTEHVELLGDKNYQSLSGLNTPDYVFMFMPVESALTLALNENPEIFNKALNKKIVMITPTTLVATLKIVKILWRKEKQVKNVEQIFKECGSLYDKFASFLDSMTQVGTGLENVHKNYHSAMNLLKDGSSKGATIIGKFEKIKQLEAATKKSINPRFLTDIEWMEEDGEGEEI